MKVTGTPQLAFCLNREGQSCTEKQADYDRGSDSETVVFRYTVEPGDEDDEGIRLEEFDIATSNLSSCHQFW